MRAPAPSARSPSMAQRPWAGGQTGPSRLCSRWTFCPHAARHHRAVERAVARVPGSIISLRPVSRGRCPHSPLECPSERQAQCTTACIDSISFSSQRALAPWCAALLQLLMLECVMVKRAAISTRSDPARRRGHIMERPSLGWVQRSAAGCGPCRRRVLGSFVEVQFAIFGCMDRIRRAVPLSSSKKETRITCRRQRA